MKNRQFILGLILFVWAGVTAVSLNIAITNERYLQIAIHSMALAVLIYNGYKLIKKTI